MKRRLYLIMSFVTMSMVALACGGGGSTPAAAPTQAPQEAVAVVQPPSGQACKVPDIVGLPEAQADSMLRGVGLQPLKSVQHDPTIANGAIISQNPPANTRLEPCQGDIEIVVSLGPPPLPTDTPEPTDTPGPTATVAPVEPTLTPTPNPYLIPFALPNDPNSLNPVFGWQPGGSNASTYDIKDSANLRLIAGPKTNQWEKNDSAPLISLPYTGNFKTQIKIKASPRDRSQYVYLCIRAIENHSNRVCLVKFGEGPTITYWSFAWPKNRQSVPYLDEVVYFEIERDLSTFTLSYSTNGDNWSVLVRDYVIEVSNEVEIYVGVASGDSDGLVAEFSDLVVIPQEQ